MKKLRVTVCQWPDSQAAMARAWAELAEHAKSLSSDLVVLPEIPLYPWVATSHHCNPAHWSARVQAHEQWEARFPELGGAAVLGTRTVDFGSECYREGFLWEDGTGSRPAHTRSFLPNEETSWEVAWYHAPSPEFTSAQVGDAHVGFLISTELWAMEPRITSGATREKWLAAGRTAAVLAGAFGVSSNRADARGGYGGLGWIIDPHGQTIAMTSDEVPFVTAQIDLDQAERARATDPRRVFALTTARQTA